MSKLFEKGIHWKCRTKEKTDSLGMYQFVSHGLDLFMTSNPIVFFEKVSFICQLVSLTNEYIEKVVQGILLAHDLASSLAL